MSDSSHDSEVVNINENSSETPKEDSKSSTKGSNRLIDEILVGMKSNFNPDVDLPEAEIKTEESNIISSEENQTIDMNVDLENPQEQTQTLEEITEVEAVIVEEAESNTDVKETVLSQIEEDTPIEDGGDEHKVVTPVKQFDDEQKVHTTPIQSTPVKQFDETSEPPVKKAKIKPEVEDGWAPKVDEPTVESSSGKRSLRSKIKTPEIEPAGVKRSARRRSKDSPRESVLQSAIARKEKSFSNLNHSEDKASARALKNIHRSPRLSPVDKHTTNQKSGKSHEAKSKSAATKCTKLARSAPADKSADSIPHEALHTTEDSTEGASNKSLIPGGSYTKTGKRRYKPFKGLRYSFSGNTTKKYKQPKRSQSRNSLDKTKLDDTSPSLEPASQNSESSLGTVASESAQREVSAGGRSDSPVVAEACQTATQSRKLQPEAYETDVENGKRVCDGSVPSPSPADSSQVPCKPESTAVSTGAGIAAVCYCQVHTGLFAPSDSEPYCQATDCLDGRPMGCCNPVPSDDPRMFRPSTRVPYFALCEVHTRRLLQHSCCPGCGLFCTQGKFVQCPSQHLYHRDCQLTDIDVAACPHCGVDSPETDVLLTMRAAKNPVFLPQQKPLKKVPSAKMTFGTSGEKVSSPLKDDPLPLVPSSILVLPSGLEVTSRGLPTSLDKDKLAELLNVSCSMTSPLPRATTKTLYHASKNGNVEKLLVALASGLNPNHQFREYSMSTALHAACAGGHLGAVHMLRQAGAQVDEMDREQNTPLMLAAMSGHNEVVKYLVKAGACVTLKGGDGMTALHLAAKSGNLEACHYLLSVDNTTRMFIDLMDDGGWTPLVWACEHRHTDVARFLLERRADPLIRDAEHNVALHWAAFSGSSDIIEMLLNYGSEVNCVNAHGDTPLHIGARQNMYNCVLLLLARGAKVKLENKIGETPLTCCPPGDCHTAIGLNVKLQSLMKACRSPTQRILTNDISRGKENNPIQCVNGEDSEDEPTDFVYVSENCFTSNITVERTITSLQSCRCGDVCTTMGCLCSNISLRCWYDTEGKLLPDFNYTDPPMLFECNQGCACNRVTCHNRVVQHGLTARFQLFRTQGKGWGVRTLRNIPKGAYVCEYIGEIISDCEADHREDDSYLFDLDNRDGETYCIDARHYGNIARFINHMCVPNLLPVRVFIEHQDLHFPRIAFFANREIEAQEELGFDYGEKFWIIKCKSFTCTCGAETCRYSETTIQQTLENYNRKLQEQELQEALTQS